MARCAACGRTCLERPPGPESCELWCREVACRTCSAAPGEVCRANGRHRARLSYVHGTRSRDAHARLTS